MKAKKKTPKKSKPARKSKAKSKNSSAAKPDQNAKNIKGSVTRHLEAQAGRSFTETELVEGLNEDLREAWEKLREFASDLGPQRIYASSLSIMFARKICYAFVRPRRKFLEVWIFLPRKIEGLAAMQGPSKKEKFCNLFKLVHSDQVEEPLTDWIREAFEFAPE